MSLVKLSNNGVKNITSVGNVGTGDLVFISKQTASSSASISFTSGIDSTYKEYVFYFVNIHPATDNTDFAFNMSTDGGSNYNVTKTTTLFKAYHQESDGDAALVYDTSRDLAQSTANQILANSVGNGNDETSAGYLHLFNPSSTTFVKHFIGVFNFYNSASTTVNNYIAGYGNTTSAIDAVKFQMSSGNIDSGDILLYGVN
jgi:hypothetical protein